MNEQKEMPLELVVGGVTYVSEGDTTFEQDLFVMQHVRASKIETLDISSPGLREMVTALVVESFRSGSFFLLLGGLLTEKGKPWTLDMARRTAEKFRGVTDREEKALLNAFFVTALASFFGAATALSKISDTSSDGRDLATEHRQEQPGDNESSQQPTMGSGMELSELSETLTPPE